MQKCVFAYVIIALSISPHVWDLAPRPIDVLELVSDEALLITMVTRQTILCWPIQESVNLYDKTIKTKHRFSWSVVHEHCELMHHTHHDKRNRQMVHACASQFRGVASCALPLVDDSMEDELSGVGNIPRTVVPRGPARSRICVEGKSLCLVLR